MKKLLLLLGICLLCSAFSCEPDVADNKRVLISGKITTPDGNALANVSVNSFLEQYPLGQVKTDHNGVFKMISLESYDSGFRIEVNNPRNPSHNEAYSSASFYRVEDSTFSFPETYKMGSIPLQPAANFHLNVQKNSADTLRFQFMYKNPFCGYRFFEVEPTVDCFMNTFSSKEISSGETNLTYSYRIVQNDPFWLIYQVNQQEKDSVLLTANQEQLTYELTY